MKNLELEEGIAFFLYNIYFTLRKNKNIISFKDENLSNYFNLKFILYYFIFVLSGIIH